MVILKLICVFLYEIEVLSAYGCVLGESLFRISIGRQQFFLLNHREYGVRILKRVL